MRRYYLLEKSEVIIYSIDSRSHLCASQALENMKFRSPTAPVGRRTRGETRPNVSRVHVWGMSNSGRGYNERYSAICVQYNTEYQTFVWPSRHNNTTSERLIANWFAVCARREKSKLNYRYEAHRKFVATHLRSPLLSRHSSPHENSISNWLLSRTSSCNPSGPEFFALFLPPLALECLVDRRHIHFLGTHSHYCFGKAYSHHLSSLLCKFFSDIRVSPRNSRNSALSNRRNILIY